MAQRSIRNEWLEIVKTFGTDQGDKTILNQKGIDKALAEMKAAGVTLVDRG